MFRIVTDTSANLPTAYLQQEHITIIPFTFHADGDEQACLDLNTFDAKTFYAQMRSGTKVSTSQIPPQRYLDVLTPMLEAGEDVLFVSMSSGISGSYASGQIAARQLREEFPARKLLLVDTYSASLGEGLLVMRAVDCRREGMSIDDTYTLLRSLRHRMAQIFTVDDLRYLRRTGRLSNLEAAVGTVLQIKPLLKGDPQGKIVCFAKLRGRQRAIEAIAKRVYHADGVNFEPAAKKELAKLEGLGFGGMPVCMAKTQYSFSDDQTKLGAPRDFTITVRQVKVSAGAGFVVALTGSIMTMPGLGKSPAAFKIDVDENGTISGLF